jgi:hypothetical protein
VPDVSQETGQADAGDARREPAFRHGAGGARLALDLGRHMPAAACSNAATSSFGTNLN